MRRLIRRWLANWVLTRHERFHVEDQGYAQPWVRAWLRREFWEPARRELLGLYPQGHHYHQENPIIRFYPLVMTVLFVGVVMGSVIAGVWRWLGRVAFAALVVAVFPTMLAAGQRQAVSTVHVSTSTDPSGLVDATTVERQKAVAAIRKRLTSRKNLRIVQNPAEATITIDVTSVAREPVWQPTMYAPAKPLTPGEPLPEGTRPVMVARAVLTRGTFTTSFAEAAGAFRASATENLARSIDSWFRANERTLAALP